jgi:hypothetical protein
VCVCVLRVSVLCACASSCVCARACGLIKSFESSAHRSAGACASARASAACSLPV